jgi:hypothetical protein
MDAPLRKGSGSAKCIDKGVTNIKNPAPLKAGRGTRGVAESVFSSFSGLSDPGARKLKQIGTNRKYIALPPRNRAGSKMRDVPQMTNSLQYFPVGA